jgi:hypothetical protein
MGESKMADAQEEGLMESYVVMVASIYQIQSGDNAGMFLMTNFQDLISDLVCLQENVLFFPHEQLLRIADLMAGFVEVQKETSVIGMMQICRMAYEWESILQKPAVINAGVSRLPHIGHPDTYEQLLVLHSKRETAAQQDDSRAVPWVYASGFSVEGTVVPNFVLEQRENWRFVDHGDGTGIVYEWPGIDAERKKLCTNKGHFVALPVLRMDTIRKVSSGGRDIPKRPQLKKDSSHAINSPRDLAGREGSAKMPRLTDSDTRSDPFEEVDKRLDSLNLKSIEVGSNGDCFFRSLCAQHHLFSCDPTETNSNRCRAAVVAHMRQNPTLYGSFIPYIDLNIKTYDEYLEYMSGPLCWIEGGIEVLAAATVFNLNIHVYGSSEEHDRIISPPTTNINTRDIFIVHYCDYHYRVVTFK